MHRAAIGLRRLCLIRHVHTDVAAAAAAAAAAVPPDSDAEPSGDDGAALGAVSMSEDDEAVVSHTSLNSCWSFCNRLT